MLTQKETKQLLSLLKKIDKPHEGLPQLVFDALCKIVLFVACELVIINKNKILLIWRNDKWWRGWHFPGGLMRYRESFDERINQVASNELGINIINHKFLFPINYHQSVRGPVVSLVFLCATEMNPAHGKFFEKMPRNIITSHKELWNRIENKYLKKS